MKRYLLACPLGVLLGLWAGAGANAQSPMPVGVWRSQAGASFHISPNGTCAYTGTQESWLGRCYWSPNSFGGVLTLDAGERGGAEYNVRWLDAERFSILGDDFYRRP